MHRGEKRNGYGVGTKETENEKQACDLMQSGTYSMGMIRLFQSISGFFDCLLLICDNNWFSRFNISGRSQCLAIILWTAI